MAPPPRLPLGGCHGSAEFLFRSPEGGPAERRACSAWGSCMARFGQHLELRNLGAPRQVEPFASSHLPLFAAAVRRDAAAFQSVVRKFPKHWGLTDRVLCALAPEWLADVVRFYEGGGGDIASLVSGVALQAMDVDLAKKAIGLVLERRLGTSSQLKPQPRSKSVVPPDERPDPDWVLKVGWNGNRWIVATVECEGRGGRGAASITAMRIAEELLLVQPGFLEKGMLALTPMSKSEMASRLGVNLSTVTRLLRRLVLETPLGRFRAEDLFVRGVGTDDRGEASVILVRAALLELIQGEAKEAPFADEDLSALLRHLGFRVARRTVAKYREQLGVPSARLRRAPRAD